MAGFKLQRLPSNLRIVDGNGFPTKEFVRWWQTMCERIETQEAGQDVLIEQVIAAQAAATAAQVAAADAADAAAAAQSSADTVGGSSSLNASYVSALSLTATDAGANVTIDISSHTRFYGDGASVSVTGASLTGRSYSTSYYIYYDQPSRAGGTVSYQTTTSIGTASPSTANPDRHYVGAIITPAALGGPTGGIGAVPSNVYLPTGFDY